MYNELALDPDRTIWRSSDSLGVIIPADGCVDLILRHEELWIAGPSTMRIQTRPDGEDGSFGLRLSPGTAAQLMRIDFAEIADQLVLSRDVVGSGDTARMREWLLGAREIRPATAQLIASLGAAPPSAQLWDSQVRRHAQRGTLPSRVAELLGWSHRTFRRRMLGRFGYSYTTLVRIERAQRAQAILRDGASIADAAALVGYADQPHLSREFKRLVGLSPGQFASSSA